MRVAIASDDGRNVASHAGRCACFVVFEFESRALIGQGVRQNSHTAHARGQCSGEEHSHGHRDHGSLLDALSDCQVFISLGMGPRLRADLASRGIEAVVCQETDARRAAELFSEGHLASAGQGTCDHD
jgi:predicted Fe-Mo cluster-binding NifX family protein